MNEKRHSPYNGVFNSQFFETARDLPEGFMYRALLVEMHARLFKSIVQAARELLLVRSHRGRLYHALSDSVTIRPCQRFPSTFPRQSTTSSSSRGCCARS